jgi:hypothetical protein
MNKGSIRTLALGSVLLAAAGCSGNGGEGGFMSGLFGGGEDQVRTELPMAESADAADLQVAGAAMAPAPDIGGRREWSGAQSAAFNDLFITARDDRGWRLMWQLVGEEPPGPLPPGAMGLGVFLGMRPTAGYLVDVTDVVITGDDVVATYEETTPLSGAMTAQMLTAPWAIELVSSSELPVHYRQAF